MQYGVSASDKSAHNTTGLTKSFGYAPQTAETDWYGLWFLLSSFYVTMITIGKGTKIVAFMQILSEDCFIVCLSYIYSIFIIYL